MRDLLAGQGFSTAILDAWAAEGITQLLPIQVAALQSNVLNGKSSLVVGPTSSGKTFVGELACVKHAMSQLCCLYLVPFKALAEEKYADFQRKYGRPEIGAQVLISTADRRDHDKRLGDGDFNIAILTYEKLSVLLVLHPGLLRRVGALIIDEIQMVGDESRGPELELLLTRARQVAPNLQIIGLSAVVTQLNGFDKWLNAQLVMNGHRPVPLREGVITPANGVFRFVEWIGPEKTRGQEILAPISGNNSEERVVSLAQHLLAKPTEQVLIFAQTVPATRKIALAIAEALEDVPPARRLIESLAVIEAGENVSALMQTLAKSVAFHNADLTLEERLAIESGFRSGSIRCIVSTSTLSMGVNLPASTVIIAGVKKWTKEPSGRWQQIPLTVAEYRNMSGRAGRFGLSKDDFGRSILISSSPLEEDALFRSYVEGEPEGLDSALLNRPLDVLLLRTIASGMCNTASGCCRFLLRTFAATKHWTDEESRKGLDDQVFESLGALTDPGLIQQEADGNIRVSRLGSICAHSGLALASFVRVVELVRARNTRMTDIAFVASRCEGVGPDAVGLRLSTHEYESEAPRYVQLVQQANEQVPGNLTSVMLENMQPSAWPTYDEAKCIKYQAIALAFAAGVASKDIEEQFEASGARARAIGSMCSWVCDTAAQVCWAVGTPEDAKQYELVADRFRYGCTEVALFLASVPHKLHRAERELIAAAGFTSFQRIINTPAVEIAKTARVSKSRVESLQQGIIAVLGESLELERRQLARLTSLGIPTVQAEALYTAHGKALEQAIEDTLQAPFCPLVVARIHTQREGEADLHIVLSTGANGIAQVCAKDQPKDRVGIVKAGAVLQQSPELNPKVFICFARPDFMDDAKRKAEQHARNGKNYKLIPISVLVEMYVRFHEGRITPERVSQIMENETGNITIERL